MGVQTVPCSESSLFRKFAVYPHDTLHFQPRCKLRNKSLPFTFCLTTDSHNTTVCACVIRHMISVAYWAMFIVGTHVCVLVMYCAEEVAP